MILYCEVKNAYECLELWNQELGYLYPIGNDIFEANVINYNEKEIFGAYDDDSLVGFMIAKAFNHQELISYKNQGFISLFYVKKQFRNQNIGSNLLTNTENYLRDKDIIHIGRDINCFFPGVPCDFDNLTDNWLIKKGYSIGKYTHDLINKNCKKYILKNNKYQYKVCTIVDKEKLMQFIKKEFDGRWYYEVYDYFANGGDGSEYIIALDNDLVIAFARINDRKFKQHKYNITWYKCFSNLGGIGPLGVDKHYRGQSLGYDIVAFGINILLLRGITEILIDWTGLINFYQKFNFNVWKSYRYMSKNVGKTLAN